MLRTTITVVAALMIFAAPVSGEEAPSAAGAKGDFGESSAAQAAPQGEVKAASECLEADAVVEDLSLASRSFVTTFGSHCTKPPFTCTIQEPGLGFGCTCTYRCSCAYCNGDLTPINCVLIDDGGCLSCPI